MGLFDGRSYSEDNLRTSSHTGHNSHSRRSSPTRSAYTRPSAARSSSSFFGNTGSSRGIFGNTGGSGSSYYKRRPRDGYISSLLHKLQRMIRELWQYARRHPVKAFFAVVVPLLSAGGAIGGLLKQFGVRLPMMNGGGARYSRGTGGYYGSQGYDGASEGGLGGLMGGSGMGGLMGNAGSLMQIAKAFM